MSTHTLTLDGASLTYDVHDADGETAAGVLPLLMAGSPMDASGFTTLRGSFRDRVVVTYDPRGTGRSERVDAGAPTTPEQHAEDLRALLVELDAGPVDVFATSGGAVNALTLVAARPDAPIATLVAHEPPYGSLLPDAAVIESLCGDVVTTYDEGGLGPAMARFIDLVVQRGPLTTGRPAPDPAAFGLPATDDGDRRDPLMSNMRGGAVQSRPDVEALRRATTRIVVGVGEQTGGPEDGEMTGRASYALARELGLEATVFPGGHAGFLGGEFGQTGEPVEFAARLREVLG